MHAWTVYTRLLFPWGHMWMRLLWCKQTNVTWCGVVLNKYIYISTIWPATWLLSLLEIVAPCISHSHQHSWWGLHGIGTNAFCTVGDFIDMDYLSTYLFLGRCDLLVVRVCNTNNTVVTSVRQQICFAVKYFITNHPAMTWALLFHLSMTTK